MLWMTIKNGGFAIFPHVLPYSIPIRLAIYRACDLAKSLDVLVRVYGFLSMSIYEEAHYASNAPVFLVPFGRNPVHVNVKDM